MKRSDELLDRLQSMNEHTRKLLVFLCTGVCGLAVAIAWVYLVSSGIQNIGETRHRASVAIAQIPPQPNGLSNSLSPSAGLVESFRGIQVFMSRTFSRALTIGTPADRSSSAESHSSFWYPASGVASLKEWPARILTKIDNTMDALAARLARTSGESDY